ncbi:hypothetical protein C427_4634 [Paraglaciecola psychrophila 170]|uniref:Uncharacterized protein n=1 Tax=Paraglaciecola psychrophila 170 TaxID=1129794 RepID=K7A8B9_9ALTE|nr:hypothetical protein C427_4634 [Paraglaciecola psychrophila 170]GAC38557.1 hypothetical protein GPSY_2946 [Paraglaciecola psychrophila 170]
MRLIKLCKTFYEYLINERLIIVGIEAGDVVHMKGTSLKRFSTT